MEELGGRIEELKAVSACKVWSIEALPWDLNFWRVIGVSEVRWLLSLDISTMLLDIDLTLIPTTSFYCLPWTRAPTPS